MCVEYIKYMYWRFYGFRIPTGDSELSRLFCWWNFEVQLVVVSEFHNYIWCEVFVHVEITVGSLWTLGGSISVFFYQGGKNVDTIQTSCSDKWDRPIFLWIQLFMLVCLLQAKFKVCFSCIWFTFSMFRYHLLDNCKIMQYPELSHFCGDSIKTVEILGQECWFMRWAHFSDKESNIYFWNEKFYNCVFLEENSTCGFKEALTHLNFFF